MLHRNPKGPCAQIANTLALKYLYRAYFKAKVYTIWVHGPLNLQPERTLLVNSREPLKTVHGPFGEGSRKCLEGLCDFYEFSQGVLVLGLGFSGV